MQIKPKEEPLPAKKEELFVTPRPDVPEKPEALFLDEPAHHQEKASDDSGTPEFKWG